MPDSNQDCARDPRAHTPWTGTERRLHPRRATDVADGLLNSEIQDQSFLARLLERLGLPASMVAAMGRPKSTPFEARRKRLPGIVRKLEIVLAELDDISAWREAADVCSALERLRADIADYDDQNPRKRWSF